MKFTFNRSVALPVFMQLLKTVGKSDSSFMVEKQDKFLYITTSNGNAEQRLSIDLLDGGDEDGSFTILDNSIVEFLRHFPEEEISAKFVKTELVLGSSGKGSRFNFKVGDSNNYLTFKKTFINSKRFTINSFLLKNALRKVAFSAVASSDPSASQKSPMTSVNFIVKPDGLEIQATDGDRVAVYENNGFKYGGDSEIKLLIPKESAEILISLLNEDTDVEIESSDRIAKLTWGANNVFLTKLEDESARSFLNVKKHLMVNSINNIKISKEILLKSLKLANFIAKDKSLRIEINDSNLRLSYEGGLSSGSDALDFETFTGDECGAWFPCKLLLKFVEMIDDSWVEFSLKPYKNLYAIAFVSENITYYIVPVNPEG